MADNSDFCTGNLQNKFENCLNNTQGADILCSFVELAPAIPLFCLSYIFEYGCALQQESDETL